MFLYNTLTKKKELFQSQNPPEVTMYNCGPTVYDYAHIGNLRAYIFADTLRRVLEVNGFKVKQVINITDFGHLTSDADTGEDKIMKGLKREGLPVTMEGMKTLTDKYTEAFKADLIKIGIQGVGQDSDQSKQISFPRASQYIKEQIALIEKLEAKGLVYETSDGVYMDTSLLKDYGKLGGLPTEHDRQDTQNQSRINQNSEKKHQNDFALWKKAQHPAPLSVVSTESGAGWPSKWGFGFPGWHIECSAMAMKLLGETIDIHTGGIDHISIHHNNEIAQSESATGKTFAKFWLHSAFLNIKEEKMSKSLGNAPTLAELEAKGFDPLAYRYWLLGAHYRTTVDFSFEALSASSTAYFRLIEKLAGLLDSGQNSNKNPKSSLSQEFIKIVSDDLNTSAGLAFLWKNLDELDVDFIKTVDKVLGLSLFDRATEQAKRLGDMNTLGKVSMDSLPKEVADLLNQRSRARSSKDWQKSDEIRQKIENLGYTLKDMQDGRVLIDNKL